MAPGAAVASAEHSSFEEIDLLHERVFDSVGGGLRVDLIEGAEDTGVYAVLVTAGGHEILTPLASSLDEMTLCAK